MNRGFSIIEIIIAIGLVGVVGVALVGELFYGQRNSFLSGELNRAAALAQEGMEMVKSIRDKDFFALDPVRHGLQLTDNDWQLVNDPEIINGTFRRRIDIVDVDNNRKEVTVTVNNVKIISRFVNWFHNTEDWRQPYVGGSFDFTPDNSGSNNHNAQAIIASGRYLYIGNANSNGKELIILDVINSPDLVIKSSLDLDGSPQDIAVAGGYAYVASSSNTQELQVIDINNPANPIPVFSFNLTTANSGNENNDAISIDAANGKLVLGRINSGGEELFIFDLNNPAVPSLVSRLQLSGNPNDLKILNDKVFIASSSDNQELQIINIANPAVPGLFGVFNLNSGDNTSDALALDLTSTRLYIGRENSNTAPEFYLLNISDISSPALLTSFEVSSSDIEHISFAASDNLVFLLTDNTSADFQVINVGRDMPSLLSQVDVAGSPNQADYSFLTQQMFVVGQSNPEVQIISPLLVNQPPSNP